MDDARILFLGLI